MYHMMPPHVLDDILKAIKDEKEAAASYACLMEMTRNEYFREQIAHAMEDEQKHVHMLKHLYHLLAGGDCEDYGMDDDRGGNREFIAGLKKAFNDELEAFEFYRHMYLSAHNMYVRDTLFEIMTDEMEHSIRFNHILAVMDLKDKY